MGKYDPLTTYLGKRSGQVTMSFSQVGELVGGLPPSATRWRAWWANDASRVPGPAWLSAGKPVVAVDMKRQTVTFG